MFVYRKRHEPVEGPSDKATVDGCFRWQRSAERRTSTASEREAVKQATGSLSGFHMVHVASKTGCTEETQESKQGKLIQVDNSGLFIVLSWLAARRASQQNCGCW